MAPRRICFCKVKIENCPVCSKPDWSKVPTKAVNRDREAIVAGRLQPAE